MRKRLLLVLLLCLATLFISATRVIACSIRMELHEIIQNSEAIITCKVINKQSHWNPQKTLIVTDYELEVKRTLQGSVGNTPLTLTFAGGKLEDQHHSLCSMPELTPGQEYLLFIHSIESKTFCPITGWEQGIFLLPNEQGDLLYRVDGSLVYDSLLIPFTMHSINEYISANLPEKPFKFKVSSKTTSLPSKTYVRTQTQNDLGPAIPPKKQENISLIPNGIPFVQDSSINFHGNDQLSASPFENTSSRWSTFGRVSSPPITFEAFPQSWDWSPYDQYQMGHWNQYSSVFNVYSFPDGQWSYGNNVFELVGWVDDNTLLNNFNQTWGNGTLAICFSRSSNSTGYIIEGDIAHNPAFNWTTDEFSTHNSTTQNFCQTTLHELGHSWGLKHQFNDLSVMNYYQHNFRVYSKAYKDDVKAIRATYQSNSVSNIDLSVSLYHNNGSQSYAKSDISSHSIQAGGTLYVENFVIENLGSSSISSPKIDWFLVSELFNTSSTAYQIGQTTHNPLPSHYHFLTYRTLTLPSYIPSGYYYLVAQINLQSDDVSINNISWLDEKIWVSNSSSASIKSTDDKYQLNIYPNPSTNRKFILECNNYQFDKIEIYNSIGQLIYHIETDNQDDYFKKEIRLSDKARGLCTIELSNSEERIRRKIIIQ